MLWKPRSHAFLHAIHPRLFLYGHESIAELTSAARAPFTYAFWKPAERG